MNARPVTYLSNIATPDKRDPSTKKVQLSFPVDDLMAITEELTRGFGTMARNEKKFEIAFDKFDRIKDAYKQTFDAPPGGLDADRERVLFDLAQTRNAIVHKASAADEQFCACMVNIANPRPQFAGLALGGSIPLDGDLVRSLVEGAIRSSVELIQAVDAWLIDKPR